MISIRKAKKGDEGQLAELFNEGLRRGFNGYTGSNAPFSKEKLKKIKRQLEKYDKSFCSIVAIDTDTRKMVGSSMFSGKGRGRTRHRVDLGWGVHPDYAGRGIGTRMVLELLKEAKKRGFKRAEAEAAIVNIASVKLAKKVGFKIEGVKKAGLILDNGKYANTYMFGKLLK